METGFGETMNRQPTNPSCSGSSSSDVGNFECNICFDLAQDPIITLCGHLFCWPCLYKWLHIHSRSHECPVCKAGIEEEKLVPLYGQGKNSTDPRSTSIPGMEIPHRPVGQRPDTAPPPDPNANAFAQQGFGFMSGFSSSSAEAVRLREEVAQQNRIIEFMRVDLTALQRSNDELRQSHEALGAEVASMKEQMRVLVAAMPQVPLPTHPDAPHYTRPRYSGGAPVRGRSTAQRSAHGRGMSSSSRTLPDGKTLQIVGQDRTTSPPPHRFSQQWVDPSQDFGRHDDDDDDGDDSDSDDETQAP